MVPATLRKVHGNPRQHRMPSDIPEGQGELRAPPDFFDTAQRAQWRYALDHAPPGLLTGTDRETLAIWCVACVEHARAVQEVRKLGQVVKTRDGSAIQNPFLGIVNRQAVIMLRAGAELGFSPASRMSLATEPGDGARYIGSGRAKPSRLDEYLAEKPDRLDS
jgi:P27 family predicted phage terminase small subunit